MSAPTFLVQLQHKLDKKFKHTANKGLVIIQYKCLVLNYVFQEIKLCGLTISKTEL
jgi:hypothetical protein